MDALSHDFYILFMVIVVVQFCSLWSFIRFSCSTFHYGHFLIIIIIIVVDLYSAQSTEDDRVFPIVL